MPDETVRWLVFQRTPLPGIANPGLSSGAGVVHISKKQLLCLPVRDGR